MISQEYERGYNDALDKMHARVAELEEALHKVLEVVVAYLPDQPPKTGRAKTSIDELTGEA